GEAADARNRGRDRIHQHRARIGGPAAGNVEADRVERLPDEAERYALLVLEAEVRRHLATMEGLDAACRQIKSSPGLRRHGGNGFGDLLGGEAQSRRLHLEAVEAPRI